MREQSNRPVAGDSDEEYSFKTLDVPGEPEQVDRDIHNH